MKLFSSLTNYNAIILKLQTNGLIENYSKPPCVLGVLAARFTLHPTQDFDAAEKYERFYLPREAFNESAIKINKLDRETIHALRSGRNYPEYFDEDLDSFRKFCRGVYLYIGFNIRTFDAHFIPNFSKNPNLQIFDLMEVNQEIIRNEWKKTLGMWKFPTFKELLHYYFETPLRGTKNDLMYPVKMMFEVFSLMRENAGIRLKRLEPLSA
jgi:DNA polymerase III epsilon subunit-like protein